MTQEELREEAVSAIKECPNVAIQAATGVGKSRIAIEICKQFTKPGNQLPRVLIVVAERAHIQNWLDEIHKWKYTNPTLIICYASLKNYRDTDWDIVIYDEAHHLNSALRLDTFSTISAQHRIFLSATLKDSLLFALKDSCGEIKNIKLNLQEAFSANILPEPKIKLISLELNDTDLTEVVIEEWGKEEKRLVAECKYTERWKYLREKKRIPNGKLIIHCTERQKYDYLSEQFEFYKKRYLSTRNEIMKNKWLQCGSKRKVYLGLLKTAKAYELLSTLKNKRYICFCTNIEQAEILGGNNAIHSKKKNSLDIIRAFNSKRISNIFAVGMLQEGINLNDIEIGIIIQLDGEERAFIQKFGRALRAESPEQYIIYYKGTRDEEYLKNALENIDSKYIKEMSKI